MTGHTISHFRVLEKLGAGGMGEVYLAEDTKLDRQVALKVLPPHALASEDDRARFYREARAAAALNHANIGHVYEIDEAVLESGETRPFIAMEYVDGESLAERISRGPLPLEDVIGIGSQIASGLSAAHAKNIVHRDIKPGNVMLTKAGEAKILDFGLAKTAASTKLTRMGSTLGTFAYMSPEQARGEEVDARTDVWSLGAVLYEMITGRMPFPGEYEQAVVYGILNEEPQPPTALRTRVPMELERIVVKCLSKDRRHRYQHVDEVGVDLGVVDIKTPSLIQSVAPAPVTRQPRRLWKALLWVFAGVVLGTVSSSLVFRNVDNRTPSAAENEAVRRWNLVLPDDAPIAKGESLQYGRSQPQLALSPDSRTLVYVAVTKEGTQLYKRDLNDFDALPIPGTEGAAFPFFSPYGDWIAFFADGVLKKKRISADGNLTICEVGMYPTGGAWSSSGVIFFSDMEGLRLMSVSANGGTPSIVGAPSSGVESFAWPNSVSEDRLLVSDWVNGSVVLISKDSAEAIAVIENASRAVAATSERVLFVREGKVMAASFDPVYGDMANEIPVISWVSNAASTFAVSGSETLVYDPIPQSVEGHLVWVNRDGAVEEIPFEPQVFGMLRLSPDGQRAAVRVLGTSWDIWVYDFVLGRRDRLTHVGNEHYPVWMPDGEHLTYASGQGGFWRIMNKSVSTQGDPEELFVSQNRVAPFSWSPDGKLLAFYELNDKGTSDVRILSVANNEVTRFAEEESMPAFSPDGRFLATWWEQKVKVEAYPRTGKQWRVSLGNGEAPLWSRDGRELFYRDNDKWYAASVTTSPKFQAGTPELLFSGAYQNVSGLSYDVTPDASRFLLVRRATAESPRTRLNVVTHWLSELDRPLPTE